MRKNEQSTTSGFTERQSHAVLMLLISVAVCLFLWPATASQLTSWDDKGYVTANPLIRDISPAGIKAIFSMPVMGNYHPLTILTYAVEYHFAELDPFLYHFDNLLIHIAATLLGYVLAYLLTGRKTVALLCSLLFALHPMHVETVAWVAGRKDSLCAVFTFAACISHVRYVGEGRLRWYLLCLLMFIGALLSKPVAVVVPLSLLLLDYALQRPFTARALWEKLPHFCLALASGIAAFAIQHSGGAMDVHREQYNIMERLLLVCYALFTYLWKSILPLGLKAIYPYPPRVEGILPWYCFAAPVALAAIGYGAWKYATRNRLVIFGLLFFVANIVLLLQFIPVGDSIVSERYAYLPYFGLFLVFAIFLDTIPGRWKRPAATAVALLLLGYGLAARARCGVWYDSYTLWADEVAKEPARVPIAYNNIGFYFFERQPKQPGDNDSALFYLQAAVELQPDMANALEGLGILHYMNRDLSASEYYFRTLTAVRPDAESYYDIGAVWFELGKKDSALIAYTRALSKNPGHIGARLNRAVAYQKTGQWEKSMQDITELLQRAPGNAAAYYYRSLCDTQMQRYDLALQDVETAISKGYSAIDTAYYRMLKNR